MSPKPLVLGTSGPLDVPKTIDFGDMRPPKGPHDPKPIDVGDPPDSGPRRGGSRRFPGGLGTRFSSEASQTNRFGDFQPPGSPEPLIFGPS